MSLKKFFSNPSNQKGFTLIELLIVIGILAILLTIVIIAINPGTQFAKANNAVRTHGLRQIVNAIQQNVIDERGSFACDVIPSCDPVTGEGTIMGSDAGQYNICPCLVPDYLPAMPVDPQTQFGSYYNDCADYDTQYEICSSSLVLRAPHTQLIADQDEIISIILAGDYGVSVPKIHNSTIATLIEADETTITGENFGLSESSSWLMFEFVGGEFVLPSTDPAILSWTDTEINFLLPSSVKSGTLKVFSSDEPSNEVNFLVYQYEGFFIPLSTGTNPFALTLTVSSDNHVWINQEWHLDVNEFTPSTETFVTRSIPQAAGDGIFASRLFDVDNRTRISSAGEDITTDSSGNIWFTQGGTLHYGTEQFGQYYNTSRIIKYSPSTNEFSCFNSPIDNAGVQGILVDEVRGLVWYSEGGVNIDALGDPETSDGNAISAITLDSTLSNCFFDPYDPGAVRDPICGSGPSPSCHIRFPLPDPSNPGAPSHLALDGDGNIWFPEFFNNAIARLTPETGEIIKLPLPETIVSTGPGIFIGGGPWELQFDANGDLWVTEYFDATIIRIKLSSMDPTNCLSLDVNGDNPCVEEMFVGQNGAEDAVIHTLDIAPDGKVWFALSEDIQDFSGLLFQSIARPGFVDPANDYETVLLPFLRTEFFIFDGIGAVNGLAVHPQNGNILLIEALEKQLGQLYLIE